MKPILGKAVNKDKVIKSPLCDLLCLFELYLSTKIDPYSIYDILVIMCMVRLLSSYIFVDFPIKWLYYCQL